MRYKEKHMNVGEAGVLMVPWSQGGREVGRGWISGGKEEGDQHRGKIGSPAEQAWLMGSREQQKNHLKKNFKAFTQLVMPSRVLFLTY